MKRLYVSDLDGTLLNGKGRLSDFTARGIGLLREKGILFTVASARSVMSIRTIFRDVPLDLPLIEQNGAFISDLEKGSHYRINSLEEEVQLHIRQELNLLGLHYFIASFDGVRDNLYYRAAENAGEVWYLGTRTKSGDPRLRHIDRLEKVRGEQIICLTVIDRLEKLTPLFDRWKDQKGMEVHLQENSYSPGWFWLTFHSPLATKDRAIEELIALKGWDNVEVTAFGDHTNDIKMLTAAHIGVSMENGLDCVKAVADRTTLSHEEDGVIRYIFEREGLDFPE
ncbi:MAG: HAD-IIB family hydrolase [Spirochaetales bacterium]|nr:HAD-IIB family hydrolase [Spirochaetales bacterium]